MYHANYIVKGFLKGDIQSKIILAFKWHVLKCISIRKKKNLLKCCYQIDNLFFFFKPNSFGITVPLRNNINSTRSLLCSYSFLKKTNQTSLTLSTAVWARHSTTDNRSEVQGRSLTTRAMTLFHFHGMQKERSKFAFNAELFIYSY